MMSNSGGIFLALESVKLINIAALPCTTSTFCLYSLHIEVSILKQNYTMLPRLKTAATTVEYPTFLHLNKTQLS